MTDYSGENATAVIRDEAEEEPFSKAARIAEYGMEPPGSMQKHPLGFIIQTIKDAEQVARWHDAQASSAHNLANNLRDQLSKAANTGLELESAKPVF